LIVDFEIDFEVDFDQLILIWQPLCQKRSGGMIVAPLQVEMS
jgi:hypothetical protein